MYVCGGSGASSLYSDPEPPPLVIYITSGCFLYICEVFYLELSISPGSYDFDSDSSTRFFLPSFCRTTQGLAVQCCLLDLRNASRLRSVLAIAFSTFLQLLQCFLPPARSWNRAISLLPENGHDAQLSGKYGCLSEKFKTELPYIIGATQVVSELMQVKKVQIKNL